MSSTVGLAPVVETVVDEKVQKGELFTAHDVTVDVRQRGHRAGHTEVRDSVHDYYQRGGMGVGYSRTNITVPGGYTPYLYHRSADDPASYSNIRGAGVTSTPSGNQQTIAVPSPSSQTDDDDDDDGPSVVTIPSSLIASVSPGFVVTPINGSNNGSNGRHSSNNKPGVTSARGVDGRQTLSLPSPVIRKVGFHAGQKVYAVASTDGVDVVSALPPSSAVYGKYTVDRNDQVRLTQSLLKRAGIGGTKYDVEDAGNKVVVKLHK